MDSNAINLTPEELDLMARTIATEDATPEGRAAVANVMMNRLRSGDFAPSMSGVILHRNAFEPVGSQRWRSLSPNDPDYQNAYDIARKVASGDISDPTGGAVNFYAPVTQAKLGRAMPDWAVGRAPSAVIGGQAYYAPAGAKTAAVPDLLGSWNATPTQSSAPVGDPQGASSAVPQGAPVEDLLGSWSLPKTAPSATPAPQPEQRPASDTPEFLLGRPDQTQVPSANPPAFDRTAPLSTQLATAGNAILDYAKTQAGGLPNAIAEDWRNATALNERGNAQIQAGENWPTFPSWNPSTWGAGGVLNALAGMAGQVSAPITGVVRQFVEQPATEATGSPEIGQKAGLVANALAGPAIGKLSGLGSKIAGDLTLGALDPETANLAQLARNKWGIPVNAGQMAEAPGVRIAASALNRLPLSGAGGDIDKQLTAWQRGVASTIGEDADKLTPDVMNAARTRIGGYYDSVAKNTTLNADPQFWQDIHDTLNDANLVLPKPEADILIKQAQNIISKVDPSTKTISGETYQALTNTGTPLDKLTESDNPNLADYGNRLKKALDGALERSATPEAQDLLKTADRQWAALKTIQPLAAKAPTGQISPALLTSRVNQATGNGMAFGWGGDLGELARIGTRFLKEPGSSNTAERALTYGVLGGAVEAGAHALMGSMSPGELAMSLGTVPATLALGRGLGSAVRSNWLANALINRSLRSAAPASSQLPLAAITGLGGLGALNKPVNALAAPNP